MYVAVQQNPHVCGGVRMLQWMENQYVACWTSVQEPQHVLLLLATNKPCAPALQFVRQHTSPPPPVHTCRMLFISRMADGDNQAWSGSLNDMAVACAAEHCSTSRERRCSTHRAR